VRNTASSANSQDTTIRFRRSYDIYSLGLAGLGTGLGKSPLGTTQVRFEHPIFPGYDRVTGFILGFVYRIRLCTLWVTTQLDLSWVRTHPADPLG